MKKLWKSSVFCIVAALIIGIMPSMSFANAAYEFEVGNTDINIQNGGTMLSCGDDFYFVDEGVFVQSGEKVTPICADDAENLNLYDGNLYYTLGCGVYIIELDGSKTELVHTSEREIKQMYVVNGNLLYIAGGEVFELKAREKVPEKISSLSEVTGIIPTQYGNVMLTGKPLDKTLWIDDAAILDGVTSCYTDSGYLAISKDGGNYMAKLSDLFDGLDVATELVDYNIHGTVNLDDILTDENRTELDTDNTELMCDFGAMLFDAGMTEENAVLMEVEDASEPDEPIEAEEPVIPEVSQGQENIVLRARQLHEIEWTPLADRCQWGYRGTFKAGVTYTGIPYSQAVNTNGYLGYGVSLEKFATDMCDNTSRYYSTYSTYNKIAPTYGTDCSGFVSYAWGLDWRRTTATMPSYAQKVGDQSIYSLQVGDALDKTTSHIVLVSDVAYDAEGNVVGVEIMEETPVITKLTRYGEGESRSLSSLQSYYLGRGYVIYRNPNRDEVKYEASPYIPLDDEPCTVNRAPYTSVDGFYGGQTLSLKSDESNEAIYYTLDGSTPTENSTRYTKPLEFTDNCKVKAIAVSGNYSSNLVLSYTVNIPLTATPTCTAYSGMHSGNYVSEGSKIAISSSNGEKIFYTIDGSTPTTDSKVYSEPIEINSDTTIKAIAIAKSLKQSEMATVSYKIGNVYTITATADEDGSISPKGTSEVIQTGSKTFKITPSSGYKVKDVTVDGKSVGDVSEYTFSNVKANHTINATFKIAKEIPFTDVKSDDWYYDAVGYAYANSLFHGTSDTTFSPNVTMNRAMFITVLGRVAGVSDELNSGIGVVTGEGVNIRSGPSTDTDVAGYVAKRYTAVQALGVSDNWYKVCYGSSTGYIRNDLITVYEGEFSDLAENQYYSQFAEWAYLMDITDGTCSGSFNALDGISREDMCVMMYNYAVKCGIELPDTNSDGKFLDDGDITSGKKTAVYALRNAGVINGMGDNTFKPQNTASRAHVSQIYMNFLKAVQ